MKKLLALLLSCALIFSFSAPAFAADDCSNTVSILLDGKPTTINYHLKDNHITYAEIGKDVMSVHDNVVYFNGEVIATISSTVIDQVPSGGIEPRTGWIYTSKISDVSPSDFNTYEGSRTHNVTLKNAVATYSAAMILAALIAIVPFKSEVVGKEVFNNVASMVVGLAMGNATFGQSRTIYASEKIYSGKIPYTRKNAFIFYYNNDISNEIDRATCYSSWA